MSALVCWNKICMHVLHSIIGIHQIPVRIRIWPEIQWICWTLFESGRVGRGFFTGSGLDSESRIRAGLKILDPACPYAFPVPPRVGGWVGLALLKRESCMKVASACCASTLSVPSSITMISSYRSYGVWSTSEVNVSFMAARSSAPPRWVTSDTCINRPRHVATPVALGRIVVGHVKYEWCQCQLHTTVTSTAHVSAMYSCNFSTSSQLISKQTSKVIWHRPHRCWMTLQRAPRLKSPLSKGCRSHVGLPTEVSLTVRGTAGDLMPRFLGPTWVYAPKSDPFIRFCTAHPNSHTAQCTRIRRRSCRGRKINDAPMRFDGTPTRGVRTRSLQGDSITSRRIKSSQ